MAEREELDALLVGALYGELDEADRARLDAHLASHPQDRLALDGMRATRGLLRDAEVARAMVEPPAGVSALLLQEAARRAPRAAGAGGGLLGFLAGLLRPVMAHPALSAAAALVLTAGAAGALYLRGADKMARPELPAMAQTERAADLPAAEPALAQPAQDPGPAAALTPLPAAPTTPPAVAAVGAGSARERDNDLDSYRVQLADGKPAARTDGDKAELAMPHKPARPAPAEARAKDATKEAEAAGFVALDGRDDPAVRNLDDGLREEGEAGLAFARPKAPMGGDATVGAAPPSAAGAPVVSTAPAGAALTRGGQAGGALAPDVGRAAAPYDSRSDAATLSWARERHARMVKLVEAGKCSEVGPIGTEIARRAPDYYADSVYNDRRIRACRAYIEKSRRALDPARKRDVPAQPAAADEAVAPSDAMH